MAPGFNSKRNITAPRALVQAEGEQRWCARAGLPDRRVCGLELILLPPTESFLLYCGRRPGSRFRMGTIGGGSAARQDVELHHNPVGDECRPALAMTAICKSS